MSLLTLTDAVTPQLIVHISAGSLAILSGAAALSVRKGARLHRVFGTVFFLSILAMSVMGAYLAVLIPQRATAVVGLFTFYFVATAWMTVKRREGTTGAFEIAACVFAFAAARSFWSGASWRPGVRRASWMISPRRRIGLPPPSQHLWLCWT